MRVYTRKYRTILAYAVIIIPWSFDVFWTHNFVMCPVFFSPSNIDLPAEVKVNLPAAFQDFVAIMLGYNAAIAILKARFFVRGEFLGMEKVTKDPWKNWEESNW